MRRASIILLLPLLAACGSAWNDPYSAADKGSNILYSAFIERPKHLDPVQSYSENEIVFTAQIYEPPLQYHYLKRPYTVIPATAAVVPKPVYVDAAGKPLSDTADSSRIAYSDYVVAIRPGIRYQPHPAFARKSDGSYVYHQLGAAELASMHVLADFTQRDSRELTADDYVYEIKRLAHPHLHSPILGLMSEYIVGLGDLAKQLQAKQKEDGWIDLRNYELAGVKALDRYHYRIRIKGKYPQFVYWLTMPFFAPIPWEADKFHSQPGMVEKNLTLDWYPIGTGPYMLTENDPNARMVLQRNPNFHGETYPCEGEAGDREEGLLADCGKALPFIDKAVFTREKEQIPYWNKFLQGYYDASGVSSDSFDQAIQMGSNGVGLTDDMRERGLKLSTVVETSTLYMGFNWLDSTVGGSSERARKLRQAISIAIDQEEFISVFFNDRGLAAQGPIPPGIFGYREGEAGINREMYDWVDGRPQRKPVSVARQLLAEAGYPDGRDQRSGEPLVINLDTTLSGVGAKSRIDWLIKQFRKIDVQLVVRSTDYNRFQEKLIKGNAQLFYFGWNADYPDPENFLFLLYGPQGKVKSQGENAANYASPVADQLFEQMRSMDNGPARQAVIDKLIRQLRHDAPWVWGYHPKDFALYHSWLHNRKPIKVGNNTLKYQRIDAVLREQKRREWNQPAWWPWVIVGLIVLGVAGWRVAKRRKE